MAAESILLCIPMVLALLVVSKAEPIYGGYNSYHAGAARGGYAAGSAGTYRYDSGYGGGYYPLVGPAGGYSSSGFRASGGYAAGGGSIAGGHSGEFYRG